MIISKNSIFSYHNLKFHKKIDMHLKCDNVHENGIFYALICINNHVITSIIFMSSIPDFWFNDERKL